MLAQHLREILSSRVLVSVASGSNSTVLREKKISMKIFVTNVPVDSTVIRLEKIGSMSGIRDGIWKRSCDYLIVDSTEKRDTAIFVELKKTRTNDNYSKGQEQLRRSLPILEFDRDMPHT